MFILSVFSLVPGRLPGSLAQAAGGLRQEVGREGRGRHPDRELCVHDRRPGKACNAETLAHLKLLSSLAFVLFNEKNNRANYYFIRLITPRHAIEGGAVVPSPIFFLMFPPVPRNNLPLARSAALTPDATKKNVAPKEGHRLLPFTKSCTVHPAARAVEVSHTQVAKIVFDKKKSRSYG